MADYTPNPDRAVPYLVDRSVFDPVTECWEWTGPVTTGGYGRTRIDGEMWNAHRYAYHHLVAPLHRHQHVHHRCGNRLCVNPAHLELTSAQANVGEMLARQTYEATIRALRREVQDLRDALSELVPDEM